MIPAPFDYRKPETLHEALAILVHNPDDTKILAGGHSLIPALKLRLAQPKVLVDISRLSDLSYIREDNGTIAIGAMTTHHAIEASELLDKKCPLLPEVAAQIGDVQVRNRGSIGGSIVHADPASDWPAAIVALGAKMHIVGPQGVREVSADDFFVDIMQSAVHSNEILQEIRVPVTSRSVAYVKFAQKASGFAIAGVAAVVDRKKKSVNIGITGVSATVYRATDVVSKLAGKKLTSKLIREASLSAAAGVEPLSDIHASGKFRSHLARVNTQRAIETALGRK